MRSAYMALRGATLVQAWGTMSMLRGNRVAAIAAVLPNASGRSPVSEGAPAQSA